jgi:hypothetical protein
MTVQPHLWVPYPYRDNAEVCTICGAYMTPETAEGECPETVDEEPASIPIAATVMPDLATADGEDDELRAGAMKP